MSGDATFAPERVVRVLNDAAVRYVIAGGLAVAAHGVIRATRDVNLVPDPDAANMEALGRALTTLGAQHAGLGRLSGESLAQPVSMKLHTDAGEVHVLNRMPGTAPFGALDEAAISVEIAPQVVARICSLQHPRQMKRASSRPRDAIDLAELDELHGAG